MSLCREDALFEPLIAYLRSCASLTAEDVAFVKTLFHPRIYRKGEFYQRAGEVATHVAFVLRGCFRTYSIQPTGSETIVGFSPETGWVGEMVSATTGKPTSFFIDAIEPSTVVRIDVPSVGRMFAAIPAILPGYHQAMQKSQVDKSRRLAMALSSTAEERYADFVTHYPALAERIPQRMLASYVGITPETLSRIRKKMRADTTTSKRAGLDLDPGATNDEGRRSRDA